MGCDVVPEINETTNETIPGSATGECDVPDIQPALIALIIILFLLLAAAFIVIAYRKARLMRLSQAFARHFELLEGAALGEKFQGEEAGCPPLEIRFENVSMTLKSSGATVLSEVSGYFPAASLVALMGPSGGGKSESAPFLSTPPPRRPAPHN